MSAKPEEEQDEQDTDRVHSKTPPDQPPLFFFEVLARGGKEVLIDYKRQVYRLRVTSNGKLILNK